MVEKKPVKIVVIVAALLIVTASFFTGVYFGFENRPAIERVVGVQNKENPTNLKNVDFNLFWDVWSRIEEKFVYKEKIDRDKLILGAISGMVRSLDDPYTEFLPPVESKQFQEDIRGSFEGIGAEIGMRKGILTIIAPLKGSPAEKAGLKAGDKILQIDSTSTAEVLLDEAVRKIRGPKGTTVRLIVLRNSFDKPREFKIVRDTIKVQIVETEVKPDGVFVIKLHQFTENAAIDFRKAVQEFYASNSKKLVFDLRNDPGGYLQIAVDISGWFLPAGEITARERMADGAEEIYRSPGYKLFENVPTVVLVNQGSASASEIVAGALRDIRNIKLVGTKTFGKGSVQEVQALPGGSSLKITIAKWLTPKGTEINGKGLEPDVTVELPKEEDQDPKKDLIMEKGIEVLKGL